MSLESNAKNVSAPFRILIVLAAIGLPALLIFFERTGSQPSSAPVIHAHAEEPNWVVAQGLLGGKPVFTRFRDNLATQIDPSSHSTRFYVTWRYAANEDGLPPEDELARLITFEDEVIPALERNRVCLFFSVQTYDGAREWTGYTASSDQTVAAFNVALAGRRLPVELRAEADPTWSVYHAQGKELGLRAR